MSFLLPHVEQQLHRMGCGLECGGQRLNYHIESSDLARPHDHA